MLAARREIERADRAIVELLGERLRAAEIVAVAKRGAGVPVLDPQQEARVVRRAGEWAREAALPDEEVRELFWRIIAITRRAQAREL
jgi:chorismate mutase